MRFGALYLAGLYWIVPLVVFFYIWCGGARRTALEKFADKGLIAEITGNTDMRKKKFKVFLITAAIFLVITALIRPQWGFSWQEVKRQGIDILIALDSSNSMLAEDVRPSRLERSKMAIRDFIKKLKGDRVGLIAFSGTAFLQCPLTLDYSGFLLMLRDVTANTIPVGGTSISNAIYTATKSYESGKTKHKVLIIITDGEDLEGGVDAAVAKAKADGITIYCIGIGTAEGELIPIRDETTGKMSFLKDDGGTTVKTHLDEETLQRIALSTGGTYVRATSLEFGLDVIYDQKLAKIEKEELKSRMEKRYNDQFQLPIAVAIIFLVADMFLGDKKREKARGKNTE